MMHATCGGQYGSEGKGLLSSYLANKYKYEWVTTNCGPNSGHTAIYKGNPLITYHLPMVGVLDQNSKIFLNAGAIINPHKLIEEIEVIETVHGIPIINRLYVHPHATVIKPQHIKHESDKDSPAYKISSTSKGVGAALADKILKKGNVAGNHPFLLKHCEYVNLSQISDVCVEVAQGFSLGLNQGFYPYCTSRQCTIDQGLIDAGISISRSFVRRFMVIRTFPIRVGNTEGGFSGETYEDQEEKTWEELGLEPEYTTVTGRERRVFTFSFKQLREAIYFNNPDIILINFAQYPKDDLVNQIVKHIGLICDGNKTPEILFGYGPKLEDISYEQRV